jgi:transcriptional antiterminator NusG
MTQEAKWYVVHTYSGYENKVKANIEKTIENRGLHDLILDVTVPVEKQVEKKDGKEKVVTKKVFPGYVIIFRKSFFNEQLRFCCRSKSG